MVFPTIEFAVFFAPVLALSWLLMPRPWVWKPFILVASYVFYAAANPKFCLLLGGVTLGNQAAATLIDRSDSPRRRKAIVSIARQQHADLAGLLEQDFGVQRPEDLSIKQASELIDLLKAAGRI